VFSDLHEHAFLIWQTQFKTLFYFYFFKIFNKKKAVVMVAAPIFSSHFEEISQKKMMIHMPHDQCFSFWGRFLHYSDKTNLV
jgi:hypothetical protein